MENNNALQVFNYEGQQVRTVEKDDGSIWFVAKDVANILGFNDATHAVRVVDDDEKGLHLVETPGGMQNMRIINESGLYTLILRSDKLEAKPFRKWVTGEVLPAIRRTGAYVPDAALNNPEFVKSLSERITAIQEANDELREQIARDQAATTFGKVMLGLPHGMDFHKAAQILAQQGFPIGRNRLYKMAREIKWLCEQKKIKNQPTQSGIKKGVVGWQSEIIDGQYAMVVALTAKGFKQILDELTKEHRPIIYLIDREESKAKALAEKKARAVEV